MGAKKEQVILTQMYEQLEQTFDQVVQWRRYMHTHPELSFQEKNTAEYIANTLRSFGIEVETNVGGNGVIGTVIGAYPGKTIALRADFDALPIKDEKDVTYRSQNEGVMHACGHDGHTAALLGTARIVQKFRHQLRGKVVFIFQHAEELPPGGAKEIVAAGVLENVDYVFGAHIASNLPVGEVAVGSGYQMAAVDKFAITIQGKGGHGAQPHEAVDSIVIGANVVLSLQQIVSRKVNPLEAAVVTIGVFQAGKAFNVIADTVKIEGTVRTFDQEVRKEVEAHIRSLVKGITEGMGASYEIEYIHGYPSLHNDEAVTETVRHLLEEVFTAKKVQTLQPTMSAEDFSYYVQQCPGTYFRVGSRNEDKRTHYPHHHPKFDIDERVLVHIQKSFLKILTHYVF